MTKLLTQNSKMKNSSDTKVLVYDFAIPAFRSQIGFATCPNAGTCAAGCYARQGSYVYPIVKAALEQRLVITQSLDFVRLMALEIDALRIKATKQDRQLFIRIHSSGDFYNAKYQLSWYHLARAFPEVSFYAYTKQVAQSVALELKRPTNFELIFSRGGKQDAFILDTMRHSKVFQNEAELIRQGYVNASKHDLKAIGTNVKIGLVYHGAKNFNNTQWGTK